VCANSKAYPANTCILEREHHLHLAYPSYDAQPRGQEQTSGIAMLHLTVRLACRGTVTLFHFVEDQGGEFSPHPPTQPSESSSSMSCRTSNLIEQGMLMACWAKAEDLEDRHSSARISAPRAPRSHS
jgi:hypothetical protein